MTVLRVLFALLLICSTVLITVQKSEYGLRDHLAKHPPCFPVFLGCACTCLVANSEPSVCVVCMEMTVVHCTGLRSEPTQHIEQNVTT